MTCTYSVDTFLLDTFSPFSVHSNKSPWRCNVFKNAARSLPQCKIRNKSPLSSPCGFDECGNIQYLQGQRAQLQLQAVLKKGLSVFLEVEVESPDW